ncbi:MAG: hypothetical protein ACI97A_002461 [Planctomycetota bacterium]|jgi:hypothetical protein
MTKGIVLKYVPLFWLLFVVVASVATAQVRFDGKVLDLGMILQKEVKELSVVLENSGPMDETIARLKVDCACLVLPKETSFRLAGQSKRPFSFKLKTGLLRGPQRKALLAFYGARGQSSCRIEVRFNVQVDVTIKPETIQLGAVRPGASLRYSLKVLGRSGIKPILSLAKLPADVQGTLTAKPNDKQGSHRWLLELTVNIPKIATAGRFQRLVKLDIHQARIQELKLHILGDVETDLQVRPRMVQFGRMDKGNDASVQVKIRSLSKRRFKITKVIENGEVFVDFNDNNAGEHTVVLQMPKGQRTGPKFGIIKLMTDHPEVPLIELRYRGFVVKGKE